MDREVAWNEIAGQPLALAVEFERRAGLEDERPQAEQAGVLEHLRPPPAGEDHHLHARPVAGLERPHAEQREVAGIVVQQRRALAEQGAVEVDVEAAEHGGAV